MPNPDPPIPDSYWVIPNRLLAGEYPGGHGRTGAAVGCYLVRHGLTGEEALAEVRRLHAAMADRYKPSPETPEQRALVRNWSSSAT